MAQRFDPHETVPLERPGVPVWTFVLTVGILMALGAAAFAWLYYRQPEVSPGLARMPGPPRPVVHDAPAVPLPIATEGTAFAFELASAHTQSSDPPRVMVDEFDTLIKRALELYGRATPMQVRDSTYQVYALRAYNRPDITVLSALRMIVDWRPPNAELETQTFLQALPGSPSVGMDGAMAPSPSLPQGATTETHRVNLLDVPISLPVESITKEIVGRYDRALQAQWEAYYAQRAATEQRYRDRRARDIAVAQARHRAFAEAQAAQAAANAQMEQWKQQNSVFGEYWRNGNLR